MDKEKGSYDMAKWMAVIISILLIGAGVVYRKAEATEVRVTKLENEMAFFKGTVTVKLDTLQSKADSQATKIDELLRIMSQYERDQ